MAAEMAYREVEKLIALPASKAVVSYGASVALSHEPPDQTIADGFDLLRRLTKLVEAFDNLSGPQALTSCARKS